MTKAVQRGVIYNAADAARLETVYRVTAEVLLHDDARVQTAYRAFEQRVATTDPQLWDSLLRVEVTSLITLVRELGLSQYRWLPGALFWQFCRVSSTDSIIIELPKDAVAELPAAAPRSTVINSEKTSSETFAGGIVCA